ncbi:hypothetical protein DSO57_1013097 [Entomophthora muscae]|uniref:Uncharacterized protein n=1 Tax=Entomophthora muscae TaxID=34485 RepID=A0ACC2T5W7_9FUNG|nr:hypothetical protein DSO57_1013097 [Entomophthora muscae]
MESLPNFIVQEILGYVESNLQLACRKWRHLMRPVIFELYPVDFTLSEPALIFWELDKYGSYVKAIQYPVPSDLLEGIVQRCPHLDSINLQLADKKELFQVAHAFGNNQVKLKVLQMSISFGVSHLPESLSLVFSTLNELAVSLDLLEPLTKVSLPGFASSNLRILRMDIALIHFTFLQSIPDRFPQLKHLSIVGHITASSIDRRYPLAFQGLKHLELQLYDIDPLDPMAFLGGKRLDLSTLYLSTHCSIDQSKVAAILKKPWASLRSLTLGGFGQLELKDFTPLFQLTHLHLDFLNASFTSALRHMFESMPNLKSLQLAAGFVDSDFEDIPSLLKLTDLTLVGNLELGTRFIEWLFLLPYLQRLSLHRALNAVFNIKVVPAVFSFRIFSSLLVFDLPEPSAFSDFLLQRSPNLHFPNFTFEEDESL